jgi:two-component system phosphate regulon sensor histidine kinase PhoR
VENGKDLVPVLVIDDERDIRDGVERFLSRMGCRVKKAGSGEEGLEVLGAEPPWVVLLDLKMPGMDGLEVLPLIKKDYPEVMVIVITGFATVETAIEAMKSGAYDFIPKPFNPDQLRITVGRAIERRRLSEEAARLEEERQRTLLDLDTEKSRTRTIIKALPFGVVVTTPDSKVALMNPAFQHLIDLPADASVGKLLWDYVPDQELCDMVAEISANDCETKPDDWSHEFATQGGRYLLARGTRIESDEGDCLGAVLVLVDMTAFKALDAVKSDFVAKVSHELRSPLSTIYLQLSLLAGDTQPVQDAESHHLLVRAKEKTEGLISFVRDLLDLSHLESGGPARDPVEFSLEDVLNEVVESIKPQADDKKQTINVEMPGEKLPTLTADPSSLESVFTNLMSNACKYTLEGGDIFLSAKQDGSHLVVEVRDTGIGIAPEKLELVFDKFYRIKNEHTRYVTGTGLGLPIVKNILDKMGAEISLQSTVGQGSTFTVKIHLSE